MARLEVTFGFNMYTMGGGEKYVSPDLSAANFVTAVNALIFARNQILPRPVSWVAVRVAVYGSRRAGTLCLPGSTNFEDAGAINVPGSGQYNGEETPGGDPDQWRAVLQVQTRFDTDRTAIRYLGGIPDVYSGFEARTIKFGAAPIWESKFEAFAAIIKTRPWSIRARTTPPTDPEYRVSDLVLETAAPGRLGIAIPDTPAPNLDNAHLVHLRNFRRRGRGGVSLNGKFYIGLVNSTQLPGRIVYYLRGTEGQNPNEWKILGTAQRVNYALYAMQDYRPYRVGIHKRGRPFLSPRGRRLTRLSLDP